MNHFITKERTEDYGSITKIIIPVIQGGLSFYMLIICLSSGQISTVIEEPESSIDGEPFPETSQLGEDPSLL